jgi:hypothetical protein
VSNLILPLASLYGATIERREPYLNVRVDEAASGKEARSSWMAQPRYRYQVKLEMLRSDARQDFQTLVSFFVRHAGQLDSFLVVDPEDSNVTDHGFGVGDNSTTVFQLQRALLDQRLADVLGAGPYIQSSKPRTNLALRSEAFDNASWTKTQASVSADAGVAPDGNVTADKLVDTAPNAQHLAQQSIAITTGKAYTFPIWVKAAGRTQVALVSADTGTPTAIFDLSAGTVLSTSGGATGAIVASGNGWYRCSMTYTAATTAGVLHSVMTALAGATTYVGDGSSGVLLWGAQIEQASVATQYIPTTSAAVTSTPSYWPGIADGFEPVTEVAPGPTIFVNGVAKVQGTDYTLAFNGGTKPAHSGAITFTAAPTSGAVLSWTGSYYRRVRLAEQGLGLDRIVNNLWSHRGLELVSVV